MNFNSTSDETSLRWVLQTETQTCIFDTGVTPEVSITDCFELDTYDTEVAALDAVHSYLATCGAVVMWADIGPVETCACCQSDLETTTSHATLTLSQERGPEDTSNVIDVWYPARFCNACNPVASGEAAKVPLYPGVAA